MSPPRRRRRRRSRGRSPGAAAQSKQREQAPSRDQASQQGQSRRRSRRRRGARERDGGQPASPASSEDLVRSLQRKPAGTLTAEHDGTTLEQVIGDLQSKWGVPHSPQEYRITIKVAEEKEERGHRTAMLEESLQDPPDDHTRDGAVDVPRREKAPAAPRIERGGPPAAEAGAPPQKRKRRRRRGRRGRGGGGAPPPS